MANVVIIGASSDADRYSNRAQIMLLEHGHTVFPIHPSTEEVLGIHCYKSLSEIKPQIDTVTMYVSPKRISAYLNDLITTKPRRVIFNPGTENHEVMASLSNAGIDVLTACTLVMLSTNQF